MNYKNILLAIIIAFVAIGSAVAFYYYRTSKTENVQDNQNSQPGLKIEEKRISDSTKPFNIDITYPEIFGKEEFNKSVKNAIDDALAEFKKISLENDQAVKQADPEGYSKYPREYAFNTTYDKGMVSENIASVVLIIYSFTGGAHGNTNFTPINYDLKNQKEIKLEDLFAGQPDYLEKISEYCKEKLSEQIGERAGKEAVSSSWINDGAGPDKENFKVFLINNTGNITIYFPQYQVAAYAFGYFEVPVPLDKIIK